MEHLVSGNIGTVMNISELTAYQSQVFVALTENGYSDEVALDLIAKHVDLIANYERRRFEPTATMRMLVGIEASKGEHRETSNIETTTTGQGV